MFSFIELSDDISVAEKGINLRAKNSTRKEGFIVNIAELNKGTNSRRKLYPYSIILILRRWIVRS
jgi:hypothetical protein